MSASDGPWAEVLACAMTGRAPALPLPEGFPAAAGRRPEDETLYRIAALGTYRLAGSLPGADGFKARPEAGTDECPAEAAKVLASLLKDAGDFPLARQWVSEAARRGVPVPFECAARLSDAYATKGLPVPEGPFEAWMAWRGRKAEDPAAAFATAAGADRIAILKAWRARDPGAARDAVAATLPEEAASARAALVAALEVGLSRGDEPFLEGLSADRSTEVRMAAKAVLVGLPESASAEDLWCIARDHVRIDHKGRIDVAIPDGDRFGPQWLTAQGVTSRSGGAARLCAMVAAAPLATWQDHGPEEWIAGALGSRWSEELRAGWAVAARREANRPWAFLLARSLRDEMGRGYGQMLAPVVLGALPGPDWEATAAGLLPGCDLEGAMRLLSTAPHDAWSDGFSVAVVSGLGPWAERHARDRFASRVPLDPIALSADQSCADALAALADGWESEWMTDMREQIRAAVSTIGRRRAIAESFGP